MKCQLRLITTQYVFWDIPKAFDNAWRDDLLFKLKNTVLKVNYFHLSKTISKMVNNKMF